MDKILAQDEVDALLRGLSGGELETETDIPDDDSGFVPFDLANQDRIIRGRMPVLEIINDRFARLCTNGRRNSSRCICLCQWYSERLSCRNSGHV